VAYHESIPLIRHDVTGRGPSHGVAQFTARRPIRMQSSAAGR
jgi:hypothetical protein